MRKTPTPERQRARVALGRRLADLRERAGLTQVTAAQRLGVRQATVCAWETGESEPQILDAPALCRLYGATLEAVLPADAPTGDESA